MLARIKFQIEEAALEASRHPSRDAKIPYFYQLRVAVLSLKQCAQGKRAFRRAT